MVSPIVESSGNFSPTPKAGAYVNVARYGSAWSGRNEIGVLWDDPRDVYALVVRFRSLPENFEAGDIKVQYWQRNWPKYRHELVGSGFSGWAPIDDPYNGVWKDAKFELRVEGGSWYFFFRPLSEEFPEMKDYDVRYRRTLKVGVLSAKGLPRIESIEAYTDSKWKLVDVAIEWGCSSDAERVWDGRIEVFNGELAGLRPLKLASKVDVFGDSWESRLDIGETDGVVATVWCAYNENPKSFDKTIVTVRTKAHSFSFRVDDLENHEAIYIKDYNVLISKPSDGLSLKDYSGELARRGLTTIYDLVAKLPEQTLERAWREMPPKRRGINFVLGCKGRRQKFGVTSRGVIFVPKNWNVRVPGKYYGRFLWDGEIIAYSFGLPEREPEERRLEEGYLPVVYARWIDNGITYEQEAFATLLFKNVLDDLNGEEFIDGDDPTVCMVRITISSQALSRKSITLRLSSACKNAWWEEGAEEMLTFENGLVYAVFPGDKRLRYALDINGRGSVEVGDRCLFYTISLDPSESHTIYIEIPAMSLLEGDEVRRLKELDYHEERAKVCECWRRLLSSGTQIRVPDEWLTKFYKAFLYHVFVTDDKEPGSHRYMSRVGSLAYGVYPNESAMVIAELDRRGLHDETERRLEVFLRYQGTALMAGMYSTARGVFYGAGGYESGQYGQHHGWVLWAFAEHYKYTRDREWLKRIAQNLVEAFYWVVNERKTTMKLDEKGERPITYGLLPPGALEDVTEFWHWFATNAHSYRGLRAAAEALAEIGHPEAVKLMEEVEAFRRDLFAAITEAAVRSPVVKLKDGTWVPHYPSRPERRGRDSGWIRETLEGAMHLILCGLIDPCSKEAKWILKDYEDSRYVSEEYGYEIPELDRYWFSRGGFSMQPNLYGFQTPYLWRGDLKHFLRAFFNSFAVAFYPDVLALAEHPLPTMADWAGDVFKTSDEAIACYCLRLMLIYERGDTLVLMPAIPSKWLEEGARITVEGAVTYFGAMSFDVESRVREGYVKMSLKPPARNPPKLIEAHFRHPCSLKIKEVKVNGKCWNEFDRENNIVYIPPQTEPLEITVYFQ